MKLEDLRGELRALAAGIRTHLEARARAGLIGVPQAPCPRSKRAGDAQGQSAAPGQPLTDPADLETAFAVSERFSFIHETRLIFDGTREEMMNSESPAIREFLEPTDTSLFVLPNSPSGGKFHEAKR